MNFENFELEEDAIEKGIFFVSEDVPFELDNSAHIVSWIERIVAAENKEILSVTFVFCSDAYLYELNVEHLNHHTYTDIITFPYAYQPIHSDIFISIDRVADNAKKFGLPFETELHRVIIHGILHMMGYKDKTKAHKAKMTQKENEALAII
jgi:probable rRNA maturation factor